ncbi:major facilitator superfamily domain-containing protein [Mrakia frigida]|uniref:major facilitator superfamily domain-containing protein n=1 Tax=Mrakia frigida TaxID=29902 RepID=UPI003FCC0C0D
MAPSSKAVVGLVFCCLVIDLLAFTIPLPLFPRIVEWYHIREATGSSDSNLLSWSLSSLHSLRSAVASHTLASPHLHVKKWDVVLLGGFLGSIFSFCQFMVSPWIGILSDQYGRRPVLLASMVGNLLSTVLWIQSTTFASFLLARLVGGLSEGNVQLSLAIISDVTTPLNRSKSLALVGLAFSLCFTFGPSIGAYFASLPLPSTPLLLSTTRELNIYAFPALIALGLLLVETGALWWLLPETKGWKVEEVAGGKKEEAEEQVVVVDEVERAKLLKRLGRLHGVFLFFFSGAEFTLTFLTYDLFGATNAQNGRLLSFIGVLSSLLQGGYTRRASSLPLLLAHRGILATSLGLLLLSALPIYPSSYLLYAGATCLAFTSASVVTGLNAFVGGLEGGKEGRGERMGRFRSRGQMGRAIGPLSACAIYWVLGPSACYASAGLALSAVAWSTRSLVEMEAKEKALLKKKIA